MIILSHMFPLKVAHWANSLVHSLKVFVFWGVYGASHKSLIPSIRTTARPGWQPEFGYSGRPRLRLLVDAEDLGSTWVNIEDLDHMFLSILSIDHLKYYNIGVPKFDSYPNVRKWVDT